MTALSGPAPASERTCDICHERPATLDVPIFWSHGLDYGKQKGTEHWCEPCCDLVFPPGSSKHNAWKHVERGWL